MVSLVNRRTYSPFPAWTPRLHPLAKKAQGKIARNRKVISPGKPRSRHIETSRDLEGIVAGTCIDKDDFLNDREDAVETSLQELSFVPYYHTETYALAEIHALTRGHSLIGQQLQPPDLFVRKSNQLGVAPLGLPVEFNGFQPHFVSFISIS
jgi:hypothetical protein